MRHASLICAALLALHALFASAYLGNLAKLSAAPELTYAQKRIAFGFNGVPVDQLNARLDELLGGREKPVALSARLAGDSFLQQRLTEALYPRLIAKEAPQSLEVVAENEYRGELGPELGRVPGRMVFYLKNVPATRPAAPGTSTTSEHDFSLLYFALAALSALGLGLAFVRFAVPEAAAERSLVIPSAIVAGAAVIAVMVTACTWLQAGLPWVVLPILGLLAYVPAFPLLRRFAAEARAGLLRRPEWLALATLLALLFVRLAVFPVVMWDGRSVWLFNAKKIFFSGMMSRADAGHAEMLWSHPDYPLLFTSWLAHFTGLRQAFNERLASLAIPVLLTGVLGLFWHFARKLFGRWPGALLTLWAFLFSENLAEGAYVDYLILLLSVVALLALLEGGARRVGYLALLTASLIKVEGLVLAIFVLGAQFVFERGWKNFSPKRALLPALWLLPALGHRVYGKLAGIESSDPFDLSQLRDELFERLGSALAAVPQMLDGPGYTATHFVIWDGILCATLATIAWFWLRRRLPSNQPWRAKGAALALLLALAFTGVSLLVIIALPHDINWLVNVTLDRLLLHPAAFAVAALFLLVSDPRPENPGSRT